MKYTICRTGPHDLREPDGKQVSYPVGTIEASSPKEAFDIWFSDMNQKYGLNYSDLNQTKARFSTLDENGISTIVY